MTASLPLELHGAACPWPAHYRCEDVELDPTAHVAWRDGRVVALSDREWRVVELLVDRAGHPVPRTDLAGRLFDAGMALSDNALAVLLCRIRQKLGRNVVQTIRGQGYRLACTRPSRRLDSGGV